jgi:hypothetical protein
MEHRGNVQQKETTMANLKKLIEILIRRKFSFIYTPITTQMFFLDEEHKVWDAEKQEYKTDAYPLTARIEIYDTADRKITVYTCDGLDALVDMDGKESQVMDAQEVGVWAFSELRNEEIMYGEA